MTKQFIHKDLTYKIRSVLFDVHTQLGPLLPEEFYREAVAIGLKAEGIDCQTEKPFNVHYRGVEVGRYFVDIWIEGGKVLLELKVRPEIEPIHQAQAISYLKVTDADLAYVVNFGAASLQDQRLPNYVRDKTAVFQWQPDPTYPPLTNELLAALHRVHFELGPGFLHQVYRRATMVELRERDIGYEYIKQSPVIYRGHLLGHRNTRLICVDQQILIAAFALRQTDDAVRWFLKARMMRHDVSLGLHANFYGQKLETGFVK